jgi:hypothetical protein
MSSKKKTTAKTVKASTRLVTQVNLDNIQWTAGNSRKSYSEEDSIAFLKETKEMNTNQLVEKYALKKSSLYSRISNTKKRFMDEIKNGNKQLLERLQSEGLLIER